MNGIDEMSDDKLLKEADRARRCDLTLDYRLYYKLVKWDIEAQNFTRKGPYYSVEENIAVCDAIEAILEEYFAEKSRGLLSWSGNLSWDGFRDDPCWVVLDLQGATMPDVWPESEGLKDGDTFEVLVDAENFVWLQTTMHQDGDGAWYLEGTNYRGDLEGISVRQDSCITPEEFKRIKGQ